MGQILSLILRFLFAWIDAILAKLITKVYEILMDLANLMLSGDNIVKGIGQRLGLILGIFMLFRLAITLINYLISPDKLKDASKGGAKLITNIIFSLVLLGTVNVIFKEAYKVQKTLINSKIIENVFFGKSDQQNVDIGYYLYSSLFTPNEDAIGSDACSQLWDLTYRFSGSGCDIVLHNNLDISAVNAIADAKNTLSFSKVFSDYSLVTAHTGSITSGEFYFDYTPILSNAVGVIALLILISFCMDLALRAIKLLFLQIIAPIPIISNMDPGKGKDTFQKWYKECFKTYITVFIRLITINFAVFMLSLIKGNYKDIFNNNLLLNIFLIIGCLLFAKQVPKLIEDMFGIKLDGMVLHPMKRFQEQALFGKNITSLGAAGLAGAASFGTNLLATDGNIVKRLGSAVGGMTSATARGTVGAIRGQKFGQTFSGAYQGANKTRNNRDSRQKLDVSAPSVWLNSLQRKMGIDTTAETQDANVKIYDEFVSSGEAAVSISESEVQKYANKIRLDNTTSISQFNSAGFNANIQAELTAAGINANTFTTLGELREAMSDSNRYNAKVRAALNSEYERIKGQAESSYRNLATNGSTGLNRSTEFGFIAADDINGENARIHINNVNDIFEKNKKNDVFVKNGITTVNGSNIKDTTKKVKFASTSIKNSGEYRKAHKIQEQANREKK